MFKFSIRTIKTHTITAVFILLQYHAQAIQLNPDSVIVVPVGGNSWVNTGSKAQIDSTGLTNWQASTDAVSVYVHVESAGSLNVALKLVVPDGESTIQVIVGQTAL